MRIFDEECTPNEAKELLLEILQCTVNYYNVKNLRHVMHFGLPDVKSTNKIKELLESKNEVLNQFENPFFSLAKVEIHSSLAMEVDATGKNHESVEVQQL